MLSSENCNVRTLVYHFLNQLKDEECQGNVTTEGRQLRPINKDGSHKIILEFVEEIY